MAEVHEPQRIEPAKSGDYLEVMTKAVFQSGISWRVVESKWPGIREAFHGFDAARVAAIQPPEIDEMVTDTRVIRNRRKLEAVVTNARRMEELEAAHQGFRNYLRSHGGFQGTVKTSESSSSSWANGALTTFCMWWERKCRATRIGARCTAGKASCHPMRSPCLVRNAQSNCQDRLAQVGYRQLSRDGSRTKYRRTIMPLHPQAQAVIDQVNALGLRPNHTVSATEARANSKARPKLVGPEVTKVEDRNIPGPGGDLPVRIYTPEGTGPFPILAWFHGGGWVVGDLETADAAGRHLCLGAGCVVVSVDYRLAPETKFPGASDDCYAATVWAANNAGSINGDAARVAVGGDSAGGNLAAAVSLMAADRNGPRIAMQLLVYPVTDRKFDNVSYADNAKGYMLEQETMRWYWNHYLASDADAANPYAAPQQASSVAGQPSALVITAEFDPLRDEGEVYGKKLKEAGVETTISRYDGMIHGFFSTVGVVDKSAEVMAEATNALKAAFARAAAPSAAD